MPEPRSYARPGQPLEIAASQINYLNALMRGASGPGLPLDGWQAGGNVIYGKNTTDSVIQRWGVAKISGIEIDPNDNEAARTQFESMPCVRLERTSVRRESPACVAMQPIKPGGIGRVAVSGVVQVLSQDAERLGGSSVLWSDGQWSLVRLGGTARLGRISGTWPKNTESVVVRLAGDGTQAEDGSTFYAKNYFADVILLPGQTRRVACVEVDGVWVMVAAECG